MKTKEGTLTIYGAVIAKVVERVIRAHEERLILNNYRNAVVDWIQGVTRRRVNDAIDVVDTKRGVRIKVYVVTRSGVPLEESMNVVIERIKNECKAILSVEPASVTIIVTGSLTLAGVITQRHLEFRG